MILTTLGNGLLRYIPDDVSTKMRVTVMFRQLAKRHLSPPQRQVSSWEKSKPLYLADLMHLVRASLKVGRMVGGS